MTPSSRRLALLPLVLALASGLGAGAEPESRSENVWGYQLADEIMSPFCPGRALSECPSPQAGDLRDWILEQERSGASRESVEAELFRAWGDQLLQAPRAQGVGLVAYLVPAGLFALGGLVVLLFLRRQGSRPQEPPVAPAPQSGDEELLRQVEDELERRPSEGW